MSVDQLEAVKPAANLRDLGTETQPIEAILVFSDSSNWYLDLQLMTDLITSGALSCHAHWQTLCLEMLNARVQSQTAHRLVLMTLST